MVWITLRFGWRAAFVATGALGLVWVAAFQVFRKLHPEMARSEARTEAGEKPIPWAALLRYRQTWAVFVCRFLADPLWYFYVFWIPSYLTSARGLNLKGIGMWRGSRSSPRTSANVAGGYITLRLQRPAGA